MKKIATFIVFSVGLGLATLSHAENRTFTSADGSKKIDASVMEFYPANGQVKIRRTDGQQITFAASALSDADQTYIKSWYEANRAGRNIQLSVDEAANEGTEKKTNNARVIPSTAAFKLKFRNNGTEDIGDLKVRYQMFYINDGGKKPESVLVAGETSVEGLAAQTSELLDTQEVNLTRVRPLPASQCKGGT